MSSVMSYGIRTVSHFTVIFNPSLLVIAHCMVFNCLHVTGLYAP